MLHLVIVAFTILLTYTLKMELISVSMVVNLQAIRVYKSHSTHNSSFRDETFVLRQSIELIIKQHNIQTPILTNRVPTLLLTKKFQDFFRTPKNVFPVLSSSPTMLNYRQTAITYSAYIVWQYNPLHNDVHHKLQKKTVWLAHSRNTSYSYLHMVFYI